MASLTARGLARPHAALLAYLTVSVLQIAALAIIPDRRSPEYLDTWLATQWAVLAMWLTVTTESAWRSIRSLPGLRLLSPILLVGACAILAAAVVAILPDRVTWLGALGVLTPTVAAGCCLFLLGLEWILTGLDRPRNRVLLARLLAGHFAAIALGSALSFYAIQIPILTVGSLGFNLGLLLLTRNGESQPAAQGSKQPGSADAAAPGHEGQYGQRGHDSESNGHHPRIEPAKLA